MPTEHFQAVSILCKEQRLLIIWHGWTTAWQSYVAAAIDAGSVSPITRAVLTHSAFVAGNDVLLRHIVRFVSTAERTLPASMCAMIPMFL